jgi:CubicO group peptidase (beta-lactamase class C family)
VLLFPPCSQLAAQQLDFVKDNGITSPLHKENVGKIVFTSKNIAAGEYKEADFLPSYRFTPKANLYMTAFMKQSLTNYLHSLSPDLPDTELTKMGNYHFSFYVDNKVIYQEPLHIGAVYPELKNTETILSKPLTVQPSVDWWSVYMWFRFMRNGGDSALTIGKHLFKMEIRPYIKNPEMKMGEVIAAGEVYLDVQKPAIDPNTMQLREVTPFNGLQASKENFDRTKIKELKAREQEDVFKDITSVVVLKNSKILIEEYFNNANRNTLHDVRSVGKSFASTVAGIAIKEAYLKSEDQHLKEFYNLKQFDNYSALKEKTTIKELLTMSSIFAGNDNNGKSAGNEENMYPTADWVKFTLDLPIDTAYARGEWHYFTAGVVLLGDILHKTVPGGLEKYSDEKLFKPLGITNYKWQHTPQKVANTAGGIQMNSLDFAKYVQLYKNEGKWNGKQILPKEWVGRTFTKYKTLPGRENEYYGYLFWNKTYKVNGKEYEAYYCAGNGGNHLYIFKDLPIVVAITARAYNRPYAHSQVHTIMQDYVLPAVINQE